MKEEFFISMEQIVKETWFYNNRRRKRSVKKEKISKKKTFIKI